MKKMKYTVAKKLYTGFFTVVTITALLGILSIINMEKLNSNSTDLTERWMLNLELINEINYLTEHISVLQHQYVLEPKNSEMKEIENNFTTTFSELDKKIEEYDGRITLEENRKNFDEFKQKWNEYKRMNGEFLELGKNVNILQGFKGNQAQKLEELLKKSDGMYKDMQETLNALKQLNHDGAVQTDDENNQVFASSIKIVISFLIVGLLAGVAIALVVSRSISKPLKTVRQDVEQVADGNLALEDVTVKNRDEIGQLVQAFNKMKNNLREIIQGMSQSSEQLAASSEELSASAEETTAATNQVATSITDVTQTIELQGVKTEESAEVIGEIVNGIVQIAENASIVSESTMETMNQANIGSEYIEKVTSQMNTIYQANIETNNVMQSLERRSNEIGQIIMLITDIADQTNLLALNAAIEAARAGEQGKGFAVVADEVRKLAEESRKSAGQISEIIMAIQQETVKAAEMMSNGNVEVINGKELVGETRKTFLEILKLIENSNAGVQELSAISEEMSASAQQVGVAVEEVEKLAKTTSQSSSEIAAATEEQLATMEQISTSAISLADLAERLREMVTKFNL